MLGAGVTSLQEDFDTLSRALAPLGIEVGTEALDIWRSRVASGGDALPAAALENVIVVAGRLLERRRTAP